jgi:hypothetical protein
MSEDGNSSVGPNFNILGFVCPKAETVLGIRFQDFIADNN